MIALFNRRNDTIQFSGELSSGCQPIACFNAANNVDSSSKGIWPSGVYEVEKKMTIDGPEGLPSGKYGRYFIRFKAFTQEDGEYRAGMGLHSGRKGVPDKAGRVGYLHCTYGCIRCEHAAMEYIDERWELDPLTKLWIPF